MRTIIQVLNLIGGLGVFLIGMRWMSDGIQRRAGSRFKSLLHTMTNNRLAGVATGLGVTSVIQSSSATTVLLVSLANAGLVTLRQSIGVIMGANIGTTFTAWIVSVIGFKFHISDVALPAIAIALPLYFNKSQRLREIADILIGFGLLFMGLDLMKNAVPDISRSPDLLAFMQHWSDYGYLSVLVFILAGTLLTVVVQSSSAAMTITITMAFRGWISFPIAAAIVLGENIGTTVTAYIASLPMGTNARRAARAHMLFNIFGIMWMLTVFFPFTRLVDAIMPGPAATPENIPLHLSLFHTLFNVANTALLLPFVGFIERVVTRLVPEREGSATVGAYKLALVSPNLPDALDSNLITIRGELSAMSRQAMTMLTSVMEASSEPERMEETRERLKEIEQHVDDMEEAITEFLTDAMRQSISDDQARHIQASQRIAHEIEAVSDACYSIGLLLSRLHRKGRRFHEDGDRELFAYTEQVKQFLDYNGAILDRELLGADIEYAHQMERGIDKMRNRLRKRSRKSIERNIDTDVRGELIFIDIVRHLEHIGDNSLNISQAVGELV